MNLPDSIRVRIFSEAVEAVGISPVVSQSMPLTELTALMLAMAGKDAARVREIYARGTFLAGASRFRWEPMKLEEADIAGHLARFPDPDPTRAFRPADCSAMVLKGLAKPLTIDVAAGRRKKLFRRSTFWDVVLKLVTPVAAHQTYSYRERADVYRATLDAACRKGISDAASLLVWSSYEQQIRQGTVEAIQLHVPRR